MTPLRLFIAALLALLPIARAQITLSEFLANNSSGLRDEDQEFSDWIEIRNESGSPVNLLGWGLTDDADLPYKWRFPSTNIPANGFLLVFASGKNRIAVSANLHTSFTLTAQEGYLALFAPEATEPTTAYAPYPQQSPNVSYGRVGNGTNFFSPPSPRALNTGGLQARVSDTRFSHDRGFFTAPFDLVISTATTNATIRYTTNGSLPSPANGLTYTGPVRISQTTILRAAAFRDGFQPTDVDTQTYLFVGDILRQSPTGTPPPGWPATWGNGRVPDYGMDPDIVNSATYRNDLTNALLALPSFSIVTELRNLFDNTIGIYANPSGDTRTWERPASVELIYSDGRTGFQENCGLRIRGGFSRSTDNPKHAFRFFFREVYGVSRLNFPVFGPTGPEEFEQFDLRTFQNYSWSFGGDSSGVFFRDVFSRDTQLDMGQLGERGDYVHLYLNGQYWGIYNTCERPEATFGEAYLGGSKDDYDVVKVAPDEGYTIYATDGTRAAWDRLYAAGVAGFQSNDAFFRVQGRNADGTTNPGRETLVNVDNLIDYMLTIFYGGNFDAPVSRFLGETSPNNFFALRSRSNALGFHFISHDAEHTLRANEPNIDRTGPFPAGDGSVTKSNPQWVFQRLMANTEMRLRFADRVQRHFFNGGALSTEAALARIARRTNQLFEAVIAESARWGDSKRPTAPLNRNDHWLPAVRGVQQTFVTPRANTVLAQFRRQGWLPTLAAPVLTPSGGAIALNTAVQLSAPTGQVYFTVDGSDPRLVGGAVSGTARLFNPAQPVIASDIVTVRARARDGNVWSAMTVMTYIPIQTYATLHITEIMYRPRGGGGFRGEDYEFIELKNTGGTELNLSGVQLTNGIAYRFPVGTRLAPGRFLVLAENPTAFTNRYPGVPVAGQFSGRLSNEGERLTLLHAVGTPLFDVLYDNNPPWPESADGVGFSLVPVNPDTNPAPNDPANWRASSRINGSPGADDTSLDIVPVLLNEVLTHTDLPQVDAIEVFNPGTVAANISGWFLTDDRRQPAKFRIAASPPIPPGGYRVFTEADFNRPELGTNAFSLSSVGDQAYIYSANAAGTLTGFSDGFTFGAAANGVSFGRFTNSIGDVSLVSQQSLSLGTNNSGPRIGPVVFNEIAAQPLPGQPEFVELRNISAQPVVLYDPTAPTNRWRIEGIDFSFPPNLTLPAGGVALIVSGEPEAARLRLDLPPEALVFGPFAGSVSDEGETLELHRPDSPNLETNQQGVVRVVVPEIRVDAVRYSANPPWPAGGTATGRSLERREPVTFGDDPAAWRASIQPSPGTENSANRAPIVDAGQDQSLTSATFPVVVALGGTVTDDGLPSVPVSGWAQMAGPASAVLSETNATTTTVSIPGQGTWRFRLTAFDGQRSGFDEVEVRVSRPAPGPQPLLAAGAAWRYLDSGPDPGTAWRAPGFDDSAWPTGRAQLGYSDGENDEITTLSFGGNSNLKRIPYFFRQAFQVANAPAIQAATLRVLRDDGVVVYLNGEEVRRDNMPSTDIVFSTLALTSVGGADESTFFPTELDASLLREGRNVLAVEVHQNSPTSSDISFDLALDVVRTGTNLPPTVSIARTSGVISVVAPARLTATVQDDGLPATPGVPSVTWQRVSGPGGATFSPTNGFVTLASFAAPGRYVLRASATDGASSGQSDITLDVESGTPPAPVLSVGREGDQLVIRFRAAANVAYALRSRDALSGGGWDTRGEIGAGAAREVSLTVPLDVATRFYQVLVR
jgi:hypothetical protein